MYPTCRLGTLCIGKGSHLSDIMWGLTLLVSLSFIDAASKPKLETSFEHIDHNLGRLPRVDLKVSNLDDQPVEVWLEDGKVTSAPVLQGASDQCRSSPPIEGHSVTHTLLRTAEFVNFLHKALDLTHQKKGPMNLLFNWDPSKFQDGSHMMKWAKFCENFMDPKTHWLQPLSQKSRHFQCLPKMPCHGIVKSIFLSDDIKTGVLHFADQFGQQSGKVLDLLKHLVCHPHIHGIDLDDFVHRGGVEPLSANHLSLQDDANALAAATVTPNDQWYSRQWYMNDTKVNQAWTLVTGANKKSPKVLVIDTGTNVTHPDLQANVWVNTAEQKGSTGVDDDSTSDTIARVASRRITARVIHVPQTTDMLTM